MCMNDDDDKCNSPTVVNPHFKHAVDLKACASLVRHVTVKPCKNMNMRETKLSFFFCFGGVHSKYSIAAYYERIIDSLGMQWFQILMKRSP